MLLTPDIRLLPEGVAFLPASSTLVLADVHLGKSATFRARGLPVPEGDTERDLKRILHLARKTQAKNLVIAGDLFHAPTGTTPELTGSLNLLIDSIGIPFSLVTGNHDAKIKCPPAGLDPLSHLDLGGLRIVHDPTDASEEHFNITGHWHPIARIPDGRHKPLRVPCYLLRENFLVLPSFGSLTGGHVIRPKAGDRIFIPLRDQVIELPETMR